MSHRRLNMNVTQRPIEPFCDCTFPKSVLLATYKGYIPDLVNCHCGERVVENKIDNTKNAAINDGNGLQWSWELDETTDTLIKGADITFHPTYSQGTAIVRSGQPLKTGMVHFWELRIITPLAGTDVVSVLKL